jgi:hypothetical protein
MHMKQIQCLLSILAALSLSACTLRLPATETPPAIPAVTEIPTVAVATPGEVAASTPLSTAAETILAPSVAPATAAPVTAAPTEAGALPATQAPQSAASQPTATQAAPTATIAPTPITAFDPYSVYGKPKYQNKMQFANLREWAQPEEDTLPNNSDIRLQFKDGQLYVTGKRLDFSTWWFSYHTLGDVYIEMTFNSENCSGEDAYGIIFRGPPHLAGESYGYVVSFSCNGKLWVYRLDGIDPWEAEVLIDETETSAINSGPDEQNVLGVRAVGDHFTIFANGDQVAEVEDDHFSQGRLGVFVRAARPKAYTYRVTNFAYWDLGK